MNQCSGTWPCVRGQRQRKEISKSCFGSHFDGTGMSGKQGDYKNGFCTAIATCDSFQRFTANAAPIASNNRRCVFRKSLKAIAGNNCSAKRTVVNPSKDNSTVQSIFSKLFAAQILLKPLFHAKNKLLSFSIIFHINLTISKMAPDKTHSSSIRIQLNKHRLLGFPTLRCRNEPSRNVGNIINESFVHV